MARGIDTKPYLEWLDGVEGAAMSPYPPHGIVTIELGRIIGDQGQAIGAAMAEVHVRLSDEPGKRTVLLPDVAFYRYETLLSLEETDRTLPNVPPEILVEVGSPNDRPGFREAKIRRYLAWGCPIVLDVSPMNRTIIVHDADSKTTLTEGARFEHRAVPWLEFSVRDVFAKIDLLGY